MICQALLETSEDTSLWEAVPPLLGALIGAGAALFAVWRTNAHQRKENVRGRVRDNVALILANIREIMLLLGLRRAKRADYKRLMSDLVVNLERLHLDLTEGEAGIYHGAHQVAGVIRRHSGASPGRWTFVVNPAEQDALITLAGDLGTFLAEWARATSPRERRSMAEVLQALGDYGDDMTPTEIYELLQAGRGTR